MPSNPRIPFQMASARAPLVAPEGKPLIVHIVVNVENWRYDQPMPRKALPAPHGAESVPDVPNFSWAEYGMRCGMPRILKALARRGLPASCALNAGVIENYPALMRAMDEAGWEFIGHGLHQRALDQEASEEAALGEALDRISAFTGKPVEGWLGPGLRESDDTADILKARGIRYICDWVLDDLPTWMTTKHGPVIAMPYTLEINDSVIHAVERASSDEMYKRLIDTLTCFDAELHEQPRVLTLALHPHLIGVPHRFVYLERMLDALRDHPSAIFMRGAEIADWFEGAEARAAAAQ